MEYDYKALKEWIKKTFKHNYKYADFLGYNRVSLSYKLSGKNPFTIDDIMKTKLAYNLTPVQIDRYFFTKKIYK